MPMKVQMAQIVASCVPRRRQKFFELPSASKLLSVVIVQESGRDTTIDLRGIRSAQGQRSNNPPGGPRSPPTAAVSEGERKRANFSNKTHQRPMQPLCYEAASTLSKKASARVSC